VIAIRALASELSGERFSLGRIEVTGGDQAHGRELERREDVAERMRAAADDGRGDLRFVDQLAGEVDARHESCSNAFAVG
jgi:hypothetical protein